MRKEVSNEKKTIVYIGGFELPDKNAAAHRVVSNAKIFRELGYNVVLVDTCTEQEKDFEKKEKCFGFTRWSVSKSNKRLYSIDNIVNIINEIDNVGYIVAYNYPAVALNKLRRYSKSHSIKIFADITEWYGALGENVVHKMIKGLDSFLRMNVIQPKLDGAIVISDYLYRFYSGKVNTVCIPALADLSEEKWQMNSTRKKDNDLQIIYAGTPGRHKDKLNLILKSLALVSKNELIFRVIGISKEEYLQYYPEDASLVDSLERRVVFLGRKPHLEVIKEIKNADFSLFYREKTRVTMAGFPTKFSESITCGTPVITNKTSDLGNYLKEWENGIWIDDIESDLSNILDMDINKLKAIKRKTSNDLFDYHRYISIMKEFMRHYD